MTSSIGIGVLLCVAVAGGCGGARPIASLSSRLGSQSNQMPPSEVELPAARMDPAPALPTPGCPASDAMYLEAVSLPLTEPPERREAQAAQVAAVFDAIMRARRAYLHEARTPVARSVAHTRIGDLFDYFADRTRGTHTREETRQLFCAATQHYHEALELSPYAERARSQIAAYGEPFDASCRRDPGRVLRDGADSPFR